jgi:hypothetical protein
MYLEGLIICVNYADFLAHTLPHNKNHFNNLVVVTDTKDIETKKICEYHQVKCLQTDIFYEDGNSFNKGAAINYGLSQLEKKEWVMHIDADIYLPPLTRTILERLPLENHKIYGADRLMCPSYESWRDFISQPKDVHEGWIFIHLNAFPIGVRIAEYMNYDSGWEPIGYLQLWNPKGSNVYNYPTMHDYCDRTDVIHCKKFKRKDRELLPEIVVIHLDSEDNKDNMGKNWKGRKTPHFGPRQVAKNEIDSEIEKIIEETNRIVSKYNLNHLKIFVAGKKKSSKPWFKRILNLLGIFNARRYWCRKRGS